MSLWGKTLSRLFLPSLVASLSVLFPLRSLCVYCKSVFPFVSLFVPIFLCLSNQLIFPFMLLFPTAPLSDPVPSRFLAFVPSSGFLALFSYSLSLFVFVSSALFIEFANPSFCLACLRRLSVLLMKRRMSPWGSGFGNGHRSVTVTPDHLIFILTRLLHCKRVFVFLLCWIRPLEVQDLSSVAHSLKWKLSFNISGFIIFGRYFFYSPARNSKIPYKFLFLVHRLYKKDEDGCSHHDIIHWLRMSCHEALRYILGYNMCIHESFAENNASFFYANYMVLY